MNVVPASYRWSRLFGTFEGFYRDDTGPSDPRITSLCDFPTNKPTFTAIGGREFGYLGDIRYLGATGERPLPLDRPHRVKVSGNYVRGSGLAIATSMQMSSGTRLTALAELSVSTTTKAGSADAAWRGLRGHRRVPHDDAV